MATKRLTVSVPDDVAQRFLRRVPPQRRSQYVSKAIALLLSQEERELIRACDAANQSPQVLEVEREWDAINDPTDEPWDGPATR